MDKRTSGFRFGAPPGAGAGASGNPHVQPETLGAEISELSDLLRKKRAADRAQQKVNMSESLPDFETFSGSFGAAIPTETTAAGAASGSQDDGLAQIMQMNMMMQNMQRSMMIQKQMFEEETKRRETDDLRMEIKKIELLILQKGMSESQQTQPQPQPYHQNPGSVRARVGSKRPLPPISEPDPVPIKTPQIPKSSADNCNQEDDRKVKKRYTNQKLPQDLILTRFTKDGPKPANNILWSEEDSQKETYDWKRQKKCDQDEDGDQVADETSDEEGD